ncbi:MAG: hypothetical protein HQK83_19990 [Fibrobacteria bacterium]|nr:hypothetical protein [Fibrobacteria bacterium]
MGKWLCAMGMAVCLSLSSCLLNTPDHTETVTLSDRVSELVNNLMPKVEEYRGHSFTRPVLARTISLEEYQANTLDGSQGDTQDTSDLFFNREFFQLGFTRDSNYNIEEEAEEFYSTSVAGYYAPGTDTFVVIIGANEPTSEEWERFSSIAFHELVHALQDQVLDPFSDIASSVQNAETQLDFLLARRMLIEGDAEFNQARYDGVLEDVLQQKEMALTLEFLAGLEDFQKSFYLPYQFWVPYLIGPSFVNSLYLEDNDWGAVDSLFSDTRLSTAEVITGEKVTYRQFPADKLRSLLQEDSAVYYDDVNLGVINIFSLLNQRISQEMAMEAIGWNGDHLLFVNNSLTSDGRFVWCLSFTSESWADTLYSLLEQHLLGRVSSHSWTKIGVDSTDADGLFYRNYSNTMSKASLVKNRTEIYWFENVEDMMVELIAALRENNLTVLSKKAVTHRNKSGFNRLRHDIIYSPILNNK